MLQFRLPPRTPSAFQQERRRGLSRSVLGRAAIFSIKEIDGLQDIPRAGCPCVEGDGCETPTSQLHTCMEGKVIKEIINFIEWGGGT